MHKNKTEKQASAEILKRELQYKMKTIITFACCIFFRQLGLPGNRDIKGYADVVKVQLYKDSTTQRNEFQSDALLCLGKFSGCDSEVAQWRFSVEYVAIAQDASHITVRFTFDSSLCFN